MALVNLKCPNCGGSIQMEDKLAKAFCMYCGSPFFVKDEVQRIQIQHSGSVVFDTNIESMLKSAVGFCRLNKWTEATQLYQKMIIQNSTDYRGWWGLFLVNTRNMTLLYRQDGVQFIPLDTSDAYNAIKVAPPQAKNYLSQTLNGYLKKASEIYQLNIHVKNNLLTLQKFISIQLDSGEYATISCSNYIKLMVPKGKHTFNMYSEKHIKSPYVLEIYSDNLITIKNRGGKWTIISSQKI